VNDETAYRPALRSPIIDHGAGADPFPHDQAQHAIFENTEASEQQAAAEVKTAGATKIADQVKNLTKFLYILGGVAKGIEDIDARRSEASPSALQRTNRTKRPLNPVLRTFA